MSTFLPTILMGLGLSMDAFSLAILYGTLSFNKRQAITLSMIVGAFHFFMPKLGALLGNELLLNYLVKANYIVGAIFLIIGIEMFLSRKEEKKGSITNFLSILFFSFTVSLDSFSVGIALSLTTKNITEAAFIFAMTSFFFTFLGIYLGNTLSNKFGQKASYIGIIILILLGIKYLFSI